MIESEREARLNKKKDEYNELRYKLYDIRDEVASFSKTKHSPAYKVALSAIDVLTNQIEQDYSRYVKCIGRISVREEVEVMQKALNREKEKNFKLEQKIEEAKTSSGLFVAYVRTCKKYKNLKRQHNRG